MKRQGTGDFDDLPMMSSPTAREAATLGGAPPEIDGYEMVGRLGEAGQGRVWRAVQLSTNREVALKVPHVSLLTSKKALARFEREIELAARLNHPNIARIYDSGMYEGSYYYAMELVEGAPLDRYVAQHGLGPRAVVAVMRTVCEAIQHAHQNRVIHRDIKPSNILMDKDGVPHVVDFGLATSLTSGDSMKSISIDGEVTGTPAYMSPEQAAGHHEQLDTRTDIYSIGVVLYKLLTADFPYDVRTSMLKTLQNIRERDPTRPSTLVPHLDRDLEAIVLRALAKEPERRYQSAAELQHDMESWLAGLPIIARAGSSLYLLRKLMTRHRYTSTVVALLLVIVVAFLCVLLHLYSRLQESNVELQAVAESARKEAEYSMELAGEASIGEFLRCWYDGRTEDALFVASHFARGTKEASAAHFLFDPRPLDEKVGEFRGELEAREPGFVSFIIAEHYLRDGERAKAQEAYAAALSHAERAEEERWLTTWLESRLYQLGAYDRDAEDSLADEE